MKTFAVTSHGAAAPHDPATLHAGQLDRTELSDAQAATYAADACARVSGHSTAVVLSSEAQALEAAAGLLTAWGDKIPVLAVTQLSDDEFHRTRGPLSTVCRTTFDASQSDTEEVARSIADALAAAGPVHCRLSPTQDVGAFLARLPSSATQPMESVGEGDLHQASRRLTQAKRPVILLGAGAAKVLTGDDIVGLARCLDAPVVLSGAATTLSPATMRMLAEQVSRDAAVLPAGTPVWLKALVGADVIVALGAALSEQDLFGLTDATVVRADVIQVVREAPNPQIADQVIVADVVDIVPRLIEALSVSAEPAAGAGSQGRSQQGQPEGSRDPGPRTRLWWDRSASYRAAVTKQANAVDSLAHVEPRLAAARIVAGAPPGTIFTAEGGASGMWLFSNLWLHPFVFPAQQATLGVAIPYAIGARAAAPEAPVWTVIGDGAFFYHAAELMAATRVSGHGVTRSGTAPVIFVFEDTSWSAIRLCQELLYGTYPGTDLPETDFVKMAKCLDCEAIRAFTPDELADAIAVAADHQGPKPLLVHVRIPKDHFPYTGINFISAELDGVMRSKLGWMSVNLGKALTRRTISLSTLKSLVATAR